MGSNKKFLVVGISDSGKTTLICNLYKYLQYLSHKEAFPGTNSPLRVFGDVIDIDLANLVKEGQYTLSTYCETKRGVTELSKCYDIRLKIIYGKKIYEIETIDFSGGLLVPFEEGEKTIWRYRENLFALFLDKIKSKFILLLLISSDVFYNREYAQKTLEGLNNFLFNNELFEREGFWKNIEGLIVVATKVDKLWKKWDPSKTIIPITFFNIDFYLKKIDYIEEILARLYAKLPQDKISYLAIGFEEEKEGVVKKFIEQEYGIEIPLLYGYGYLLLTLLKGYDYIKKIFGKTSLFKGGI